VKINLYDDDVLKQALDDLGIPYDDNPPTVVKYATKTSQADIRLKNRSVGFSKTDGQWSIVGDDMYVDSFRLEHLYACAKVEKQFKSMGYLVNGRQKQKNGSVKIKVLVP
jgi:hypothetical protein